MDGCLAVSVGLCGPWNRCPILLNGLCCTGRGCPLQCPGHPQVTFLNLAVQKSMSTGMTASGLQGFGLLPSVASFTPM